MNDLERLRLLDFLDHLNAPWRDAFPEADTDATSRILNHLFRAHIRGETVTISSLAQSGYAPYTTSMRKIDTLLTDGLIVRVTRGATGKSFALKPSPESIHRFETCLLKVKAIIVATMGRRLEGAEPDSYYFGAPRAAPANRMPSVKCGDSSPDMRFLLADDNYFIAMQNLWGDFRNESGSRQDIELARLPQLHRLALENGQRDASRFHLVALNLPWLGEFASKGLIRPLDRELPTLPLRGEDFNDNIWKAGQYAGRQYGVPIYCTIETLAVRRDLIEEAGHQPPATFDQVIKLGRALHAPSHGRYGIVWNAARGMPIASSFMFLLADCGEYIVPRTQTTDPENIPQISVEVGMRVLDYMHRLVEIAPPDVLSLDWESSFDIFLRGDAAMIYCWSMRGARLEYDTRSRVKRRVTYLPHPAGPHGRSRAPLGGFVLTIPANLPDEQVPTAVEAMSWMLGPDSVRNHVKNGLPFLPRFSVVADPEVMQSSPIVSFVEKAASRNMLDAWARPPVANYTALEAIIGSEIHDALLRRKSDREAISSINHAISMLSEAASHRSSGAADALNPDRRAALRPAVRQRTRSSRSSN